MPSNRLSKVQKHIAKKKGKDAFGKLHENSRDTHRLQAAAARDDKINRLESLRAKQNRHYLDRVKAIRTLVASASASPDSDTLTPLDLPATQSLITTYLSRHDEELATLKAARRPGRPASNREVLLTKSIEQENKEFVSGYWVPDLSSEHNLVKLQNWDGKWGGLATMKFVRVTKQGVRHESSFPPKGMS